MQSTMKQLSSIRAVIFDWAGTTVDHGSLAPALAFVEIFQHRGIDITTEEARGPMGKSKREHIATILELPRISELWRSRYGRDFADADIQSMYDEFLPLQKRLLEHHSHVIPGVPEVVRELRRRGMKIGSSTGYSRDLMQVVVPIAASEGYSPDVMVCSDDVPAGRPAPWMNFLVAQQLQIYPMGSILVVDDTPIGIQAGLNAGAVTVAVARTGNSLGLSLRETEELSPSERNSRLERIRNEFIESGADYVVDSAADLISLFE